MALNAILAADKGITASIVLVLVFNGIWFGAAIASVVISCCGGGGPQGAVAGERLVRRHARATTILVFGAVGAYLSVKGAAQLIG